MKFVYILGQNVTFALVVSALENYLLIISSLSLPSPTLLLAYVNNPRMPRIISKCEKFSELCGTQKNTNKFVELDNIWMYFQIKYKRFI